MSNDSASRWLGADHLRHPANAEMARALGNVVADLRQEANGLKATVAAGPKVDSTHARLVAYGLTVAELRETLDAYIEFRDAFRLAAQRFDLEPTDPASRRSAR